MIKGFLCNEEFLQNIEISPIVCDKAAIETNVPVDGQMSDAGKASSPFFFLISNRLVFQLRLTSLRSLDVSNILVI